MVSWRQGLNGGMPPRGPRRYLKTLASHARIVLLHELTTRGPRTVEQLAESVGLHPNTTREHLTLLTEAGFVTSDPLLDARRGRPRLSYRATTPGYRGESTTPDARGGARSAPAAQQLARLLDHLTDCGFTAAVSGESGEVVLRQCPYRALAQADPRVCRVQFTLARAALGDREGPLRATSLRACPGAQTCALVLGARAPVQRPR